MDVVHYLDSARLGLMSPSASRRHGELARFATIAAASPLMDTLLQDGGGAWPRSLQRQFPELSSYPGVPGFRRRLLETLGCEDWQRLILGTASNSLIRIASQLLFGPCERVLVTDLAWPVYRKVLERCSAERSRALHIIPLRRFIAQDCLPSVSDTVDFVSDQFRKFGCDGLFLTSVSHDGIRLPVAEMIAAIKGRSEVRMSVIDGAQEFAQVDHRRSLRAADFYMTSGHKWAGSYVPISIGVFGADRSASRIDQVLADQIESGAIDDPLMQLCWDSTNAKPMPAPSTANVSALFACDAAISDLQFDENLVGFQPLTDDDVSELFVHTESCGWKSTTAFSDFRSRTCIMHHPQLMDRSAASVRSSFAAHGIALTAYDRGAIRISVPASNRWAKDKQADTGHRLAAATSALVG